MKKEDFEKLPIGGHAAGNLTREEEQLLYRAALDDQEVFDELADAEDMRRLMASPRARRELLDALDQADRSLLDRLVAWVQQPAGLAIAGSLAAVAFAVGLYWDQIFRTGSVAPDGPGLAGYDPAVSGDPAAQWFSLGQSQAVNASIELNQQSYRVGDPFRIRVSAPAGWHAVIVEKRADGRAVQLFPNSLQEDTRIGGEGQAVFPAAGQGSATIEGPSGARTLRLVLLPPDSDPGRALPGAFAGRVTVIDRSYLVQE